HQTWVGGNIGDVLLHVLPIITPKDRVVMELSSFQLELMSMSPPISAITNITPNHLDRHGTMDAYIAAKANIAAYQGANDITILGWDDANTRALGESGQLDGRIAWFSGRDLVSDGAFCAGERLLLVGEASYDGSPHVICERKEIQLRGDHNVLNVLAACAITGSVGVKPDVMAEVIREFKGVAHRLEIVRVKDGVTYINDSIATAPERVTAALKSFEEPLVLLLGGRDKKLPWSDMIGLALTKTRQIVAFGEAAEIVVKAVKALTGRDDIVTVVKTLDEAVSAAIKVAEAGDVVLLSPGGTSYDAYVDFAERGEHFRKLVNAL
ncbi:MAG: UDP-N-acetylmuramoyl-L-alanine--D-glutamate ligase, partial [Anaerolinea sp.]|nr:UDP-N-acetylmuramoyl-L-alanine--D-glutamate ligase [Anaerolinea sp.]